MLITLTGITGLACTQVEYTNVPLELNNNFVVITVKLNKW